MNIRNFTATIANGASTSSAIELGNATVVGVYIPAAFTGTAITFTACSTATGTFSPLKDGAGAAISKTVAAGDYIYLDPVLFAGVAFVKIVSGSAEAAARTLTLVARIV
jgi:hypothetical protein